MQRSSAWNWSNPTRYTRIPRHCLMTRRCNLRFVRTVWMSTEHGSAWASTELLLTYFFDKISIEFPICMIDRLWTAFHRGIPRRTNEYPDECDRSYDRFLQSIKITLAMCHHWSIRYSSGPMLVSRFGKTKKMIDQDTLDTSSLPSFLCLLGHEELGTEEDVWYVKMNRYLLSPEFMNPSHVL
jgi:hypothetical protein